MCLDCLTGGGNGAKIAPIGQKLDLRQVGKVLALPMFLAFKRGTVHKQLYSIKTSWGRAVMGGKRANLLRGDKVGIKGRETIISADSTQI